MQNCLTCAKKNLWRSSKWVEDGRRWWECRNCGQWQLEEPPQGLRIPPRILYVDIETALMRVSLYDLYSKANARISKDAIERFRYVINWAAAWVTPETYEVKKIMTGVVTQSEAKRQNDKRILRPLFDLMDESDYICTHNGRRFDVPILKWRFLYHGWGYPSESKQVDTFTLSSRGKPESRALDFLLKQRGYEGKKHTLDGDEWREIANKGTPQLLRKADRYCRQDVKGGVNLLREYVLAEQQSGKVLFR